MSKKRPLNFQAPSFAEDAPPPPRLEDGASLGAPVPTAKAEPGPQPAPRALAGPAARKPASKPAKVEGGGFVWFLAAVATVLWAGGLAAYTLGFRGRVGPFEDEPFTFAVLGLLGAAPVGLIWIGAYALRQGLALMAEARRLQSLSRDMVVPAALAASDTSAAVEAIRQEIEGAAAAAERARAELGQLRERLSQESDRLIEMASGSARDATQLVQTLGRERQEFGLLQGKLENRVGEIGDAIARHAKMVAEASDLAQTQIQEAEAALAARAADLAAAAGEATEAARMAGDDLARQAARVEQAGVTVGEQVQAAEDTLGQQRAALVTLAHALRTEQEDLAVHFESQRAQLAEMLRQSEQGAVQVGDVAKQAAERLRELIASAADTLRDMGDQAQTERDLLSGAALQSLGAFSEAAAFERRALEEDTRRSIDELAAAAETAHRAAEAASAAARTRIEALTEAAFASGQTADDAFHRRLEEARGLIDRSAALVEDAGARSTHQLERTLSQAYGAIEGLEQRLAEIDARAQSMPQTAAARGEEIRQALDHANERLLASARQAAEELERIDSAFQERVRRNYEMLSEAVRLMGVLGGGAANRAGQAPVAARPAPPPQAPPLPLRPRAETRVDAPPTQPEEVGLRPRLKLTPAPEPAEDDMFEDEDAPRPPAADDPDWSWNELVAALDETEADDAELERGLIAQIDALGIDAVALIPRRRLDDIARLYEGGDAEGAREVIHRLAPAAVRKLARRVLSDKLMRAQADRLIERYHDLLRGVARRGSDGLTAAGLLGSDAGRAFLLLDAALGDLG